MKILYLNDREIDAIVGGVSLAALTAKVYATESRFMFGSPGIPVIGTKHHVNPRLPHRIFVGRGNVIARIMS